MPNPTRRSGRRIGALTSGRFCAYAEKIAGLPPHGSPQSAAMGHGSDLNQFLSRRTLAGWHGGNMSERLPSIDERRQALYDEVQRCWPMVRNMVPPLHWRRAVPNVPATPSGALLGSRGRIQSGAQSAPGGCRGVFVQEARLLPLCGAGVLLPRRCLDIVRASGGEQSPKPGALSDKPRDGLRHVLPGTGNSRWRTPRSGFPQPWVG